MHLYYKNKHSAIFVVPQTALCHFLWGSASRFVKKNVREIFGGFNKMDYLCVIKAKGKRSRRRKPTKTYHIKVDWETHQLIVKYRDKLSCLMSGPIPLSGEWRCPRHQGGLQRTASTQILSFGVSSHSFDVDLKRKGRPHVACPSF